MSAKYGHYQLLTQPVITEKSYQATGANNQYTFRVAKYATKPKIKAAVEAAFDVKVEKVQMINLPAKSRRRGQHSGQRSGYRKAVVRLAEGFSLETMDEA